MTHTIHYLFVSNERKGRGITTTKQKQKPSLAVNTLKLSRKEITLHLYEFQCKQTGAAIGNRPRTHLQDLVCIHFPDQTSRAYCFRARLNPKQVFLKQERLTF